MSESAELPPRSRKRARKFSPDPPSPISKPSPARRKGRAEQKELFSVEAVLDDRVVDGITEYLLLWKGYPREDASWSSNTDCQELISAYFRSKAETLARATTRPLAIPRRKRPSRWDCGAPKAQTSPLVAGDLHECKAQGTIGDRRVPLGTGEHKASSAARDGQVAPSPLVDPVVPPAQRTEHPQPLREEVDPVAAFLAQPAPVPRPHYTTVPCFEDLQTTVEDLIVSARRIPAGSTLLWKPAVSNLWAAELRRLTDLFDSAMSNPTPLNLFNAVFGFVAAPGSVLGPNFKVPSQAGPEFVSTAVTSAVNKIMRGQERKAMKLLCSNGVARINEETLEALRKLHPERKSDLVLPVSIAPQLTVDPAFVAKKLFRAAGDHNLSKDVFGWAPWLFYTGRGEKKGFFASFVMFACFLANNPRLFPPVCALLLSGGALTPLHKLNSDERKEREEALLPPKLRPINSGSLLAKTVLAAVMASPAGERAATRVAPFQLSLGTSRGVEKLIHICRAAYENKWLVGKNDYENGFNSLSRQKMLDSHCRLFPESTDIFNFFYGIDSPVYVLDDDLNLTILKSEEGSRQGCTAGTEAFCFAIHPVVAQMQILYPEFEFRILTDDIVPLQPPPADNSFDSWQTHYRRYAACLKDLESLSLEYAGLVLNLEKGALLLPRGAPLPTPEVYSLFPRQFKFCQDGMRIAGSPVGTDAFMQGFVESKVAEARLKLAAIKLVSKKSPRAAHRLVTGCVTKLLCFLAATVPPHIAVPLLQTFDSHVEQCFFSIISPGGFSCAQDRMERARLKASLPSPFGCGLFKGADQAHIAWWSSVVGSLSDPLLFKLRDGLEKFAESAWNHVVALHGGLSSKFWGQVQHLFPNSPQGLLDGSRYSPSTPNTVKLTQVALRNVAKQKLELFQSKIAVSLLSDTLTEADIINASARSFSGRIFSEPLKSDTGFGNDDYLAWCRFFLGLPPAITIGGATGQDGFDYPVQKCLASHGVHVCPFLDAAANHASSKCPATAKAIHTKHDSIVRVLANAAREAGCEAQTEPSTHSLLLGELPKELCRRIFPSKVTQAYKEGFDALQRANAYITSDDCKWSVEEKAMHIQSKIDALPFLAAGDTKGLRIDVNMVNPLTGETKWVDVAVSHTSSQSYANTELKAIATRKLCTHVAELHLLPDALENEPSPTLTRREQEKVDKYSRLVFMAKQQKAQNKRISIPTFTPFVISDCGELSPMAFELQEWIVEQYRRKCAKVSPRADGCTVPDLVRQFRHKLRVDIQLALAAGLGAMINAAGLAWK